MNQLKKFDYQEYLNQLTPQQLNDHIRNVVFLFLSVKKAQFQIFYEFISTRSEEVLLSLVDTMHDVLANRSMQLEQYPPKLYEHAYQPLLKHIDNLLTYRKLQEQLPDSQLVKPLKV